MSVSGSRLSNSHLLLHWVFALAVQISLTRPVWASLEYINKVVGAHYSIKYSVEILKNPLPFRKFDHFQIAL